MISGKFSADHGDANGSVVVSGEMHLAGAGELFPGDSDLSASDVSIMRTIGGGVTFSFSIAPKESKQLTVEPGLDAALAEKSPEESST